MVLLEMAGFKVNSNELRRQLESRKVHAQVKRLRLEEEKLCQEIQSLEATVNSIETQIARNAIQEPHARPLIHQLKARILELEQNKKITLARISWLLSETDRSSNSLTGK